jgi:Putative auto-transporter adhesin, head GIN domain
MSSPRFLSVLLALSLSGCIIHIGGDGDGDWSWGNSPVLQGSGVRSTQARSVGEFQRVRASLSGDVHVVVGQAARVEVSCDDNLLEHVRTRVVDGELQIDTDGQSMAFRESLRVEIACPALAGATLSGSGALKVEGLAGERFEASLSGSGDLSARGKVAQASLSLTGSGELDCRELQVQEAQVSLAGSGDVHVQATGGLSVSISGSGDVRYSGAPARITRSVAGSGTIAPE